MASNTAQSERPPVESEHTPRGKPHGDTPHAEIPKDLPKITGKQLFWMAVVVGAFFLILFLVGFIPHIVHEKHLAEEADAIADQPPIVQVVAPTSTQLSIDLPLPGTSYAMQETSLYARINGYLAHRYVDIGDRVKTGQLLADISAPDLDAQLAQAEGALEQAKANLASAKTNDELALATLNRYKGLVPTGSVTQQDLDTRQTAFNQADAALQGADASVKSAQATVQQLQAQQSFEKITAPFDGVVTIRNYDVGALISSSNTGPNAQIFTVSQTDILRVFVNVPQSYASFIQLNQPAALEVSNYPGKKFTGHVARWAGALDTATRTMLTELHFDNKEGQLWPGMYGKVTFNIKREKPVFTVPTSALEFEANGTQLALVQDSKVHYQKVQVGRDFGTAIEILVGLNGDEQVIANPGEKLTEGITVQVAGSAQPTGPGGGPAK